MGTTTTTQSTNQYNPAANTAYNAFQPQIMSQLMQMAQNPLGNSYFQHQLAQQQSAAQQINQRSQSNSLQNLRTGGGVLSNSGGVVASLINRNQMQGSALQSNAFNTAMNSALQNRNMALMSMESYQPLQTGNTTTQSTGGLGTWLPQLAGAALGGISGGLTGGLAGAFGGAASGMSGNFQSGGNGSMQQRPAPQQSNPWAQNVSWNGGGSGQTSNSQWGPY